MIKSIFSDENLDDIIEKDNLTLLSHISKIQNTIKRLKTESNIHMNEIIQKSESNQNNRLNLLTNPENQLSKTSILLIKVVVFTIKE